MLDGVDGIGAELPVDFMMGICRNQTGDGVYIRLFRFIQQGFLQKQVFNIGDIPPWASLLVTLAHRRAKAKN